MLKYLIPLAAYLIGSVSSAVLVARLFGLRDPRTVGSGNPGATNILRYGGKTAAATTLFGDMLKGVVAVLLARLFTSDPTVIALAMLVVFLGHLYPVFFRFQGGKGVATMLGVYLAADPWIGITLSATWLVVAMITRYSSLSALMAGALSPLYVWWWLPAPPYLAASLAISGFLFWRHRENIRRLFAGEEAKIGQ